MTSLPVPLSPLMNTEASVGGHLAGQLDRLAEAGRDADQGELVAVAVLLLQLEPELAGLARDHDGVGGAADQDLEVRGRERLGEVVPGARRAAPRCCS